MELDPVCGAPVDPDKTQHRTEYQGRSYYFCSRQCKELFDQQPDKWLSEEAA